MARDMRRLAIRIIVFFLVIPVVCAQGLILHQSDLWTLPYEDMSDIFRRYPGMYPLDYGTLGAPLFFHPWGLNPWEMRVERDGIPQNRRFDGLYDLNLQPGNEIETIQHHPLDGGPAGIFRLSTRALKTDTPYTEFQIREGFYGYGTVDFAHGQRLYRSLSLELTGRLGWYDGMRIPADSRTTRIRGRIGFALGQRWRTNLTYAGSKAKSGFILSPDHPYFPSREEGILEIVERDSARTALSPSIRIYSREDRESWGSHWKASELSTGIVTEANTKFARQYQAWTHHTSWTEMNVPGMERRAELSLRLALRDSIPVSGIDIIMNGVFSRESEWSGSREQESRWIGRYSFRFENHPIANISGRLGFAYAETPVPISWCRGQYALSDRPLVIFPEMRDMLSRVVPINGSLPVDRYLKSEVGAKWVRDEMLCDLAFITINRPGDLETRFTVSNNTVRLASVANPNEKTIVGITGGTIVPLWYGFQLESWWSAQSSSDQLTSITDARGWTRIYFEHDYFDSPLTIRSHISYEHIGRRTGFSDRFPTSVILGPNHLLGFRVSATIKGVTIVWGTENVLKDHYSLMPGYPMIGKEEYLAFIWRLWL